MTEHPNAANTRRGYEAWNSGDLDFIREYFTEDAVLHLAGNNAMSGTYRGRDAVMDALARDSQGWGPHAEMETILASDDHVIAFFQVTSERDGKTLDVVLAQAIKLDADGKATEAWFLPNDQRGYDQFFS
jgi:ketosteroid isomerase-like protein